MNLNFQAREASGVSFNGFIRAQGDVTGNKTTLKQDREIAQKLETYMKTQLGRGDIFDTAKIHGNPDMKFLMKQDGFNNIIGKIAGGKYADKSTSGRPGICTLSTNDDSVTLTYNYPKVVSTGSRYSECQYRYGYCNQDKFEWRMPNKCSDTNKRTASKYAETFTKIQQTLKEAVKNIV